MKIVLILIAFTFWVATYYWFECIYFRLLWNCFHYIDRFILIFDNFNSHNNIEYHLKLKISWRTFAKLYYEGYSFSQSKEKRRHCHSEHPTLCVVLSCWADMFLYVSITLSNILSTNSCKYMVVIVRVVLVLAHVELS